MTITKIAAMIIYTIVLTIPMGLHAEDIPNVVESVACTPGGEFGNMIHLKLSKQYKYGQLTIKRSATGSDYTRNLTSFQGGNYNIDLASKGGISGLSLEYGFKSAAELQALEKAINCGPQAPEPSQPSLDENNDKNYKEDVEPDSTNSPL